MSLSALEKIQEIQARADQEIRELRQQAVSDVVRRLSEAKSLLAELEAQYKALAGKNVKGEAVVAPKAEISGREQLADLLKAAPGKRLTRKG